MRTTGGRGGGNGEPYPREFDHQPLPRRHSRGNRRTRLRAREVAGATLLGCSHGLLFAGPGGGLRPDLRAGGVVARVHRALGAGPFFSPGLRGGGRHTGPRLAVAVAGPAVWIERP